MVRSRFAHGSVTVRSQYCRSSLQVRRRYGTGTVRYFNFFFDRYCILAPSSIFAVWLCGKIRQQLTTCYSCTMVARGLRGVRKWRLYIDHEGGARVGL